MSQTLPKVAGAELNSEISVEINTTPTGESATYSDMTEAFKSVAIALNEQVYSANYLSDSGYGSSTVTGLAPTITLTGDFIKGDAVCEWLDTQQWTIGAGRVTDIKLTRNGNVVTCPVTLTAITIGGGNSTEPNSVSVTIAFNGQPTVAAVTPGTE